VKLPRDVAGLRVVRLLERLGDVIIRQKGSHCRLSFPGPPSHTITVPLHDALKVGTLHGILSEVTQMRPIPMDKLVDLL